MRKIFYFVVLCLIIACDSKTENNNNQEINSLKKLSEFVANSRPIRDSIKNYKKRKVKLMTCVLASTETHNKITFTYTYGCYPFQIDCDYVYKSIDGVDIIFYDFRKPLVKKTISKNLKTLIDKNIVKFEPSNMLCCMMPYDTFVFCKSNPQRMSCYDNEIEGKRHYEYIKGGPKFTEDMLYPKCD